MPVVPDMLASWRRPRAVIARKLAAGPREDRALATLMGACGLIFVAQWPGLSREAHFARLAAEAAGTPLDQVPTLQALMGSRLMAIVFIAPLVFYALAAISHLVARLSGGKGSPYGARLALFWALFCTTPLMLLQGLVAGFLGAGAANTAVGVIVLGLFLYLWINMLIEAQKS